VPEYPIYAETSRTITIATWSHHGALSLKPGNGTFMTLIICFRFPDVATM
jgi:hypothetical protein